MKVLIVDDCDITIQLIMEILNSIPGIATYSANNGIECLSKVSTFKPDVIFLDINLGGEISAGIDVARAVSEISPRTQIIFVTGYPEFAVKAFQLEAVDYLVKPFTEGQVVMALNKAKKRLQNTPKKVPFKNGLSMVFIDPNEILFIEKEGRKTLIHTDKEIITINDSLSNIHQQLNAANFYRSHILVYIKRTHCVLYFKLNLSNLPLEKKGEKLIGLSLRKNSRATITRKIIALC